MMMMQGESLAWLPPLPLPVEAFHMAILSGLHHVLSLCTTLHCLYVLHITCMC